MCEVFVMHETLQIHYFTSFLDYAFKALYFICFKDPVYHTNDKKYIFKLHLKNLFYMYFCKSHTKHIIPQYGLHFRQHNSYSIIILNIIFPAYTCFMDTMVYHAM